jgi:acyl dehydratase
MLMPRQPHSRPVWRRGGFTITLMYRFTTEIVNQPGRQWAFLGGLDWQLKFIEPVCAGGRLQCARDHSGKRPSSKPDRVFLKTGSKLSMIAAKVSCRLTLLH